MKKSIYFIAVSLFVLLCGCGTPPHVPQTGEIAFWDGDYKIEGTADGFGIYIKNRIMYSAGDNADFSCTLPKSLEGIDTMVVELSTRNISEKDSLNGLMVIINNREIWCRAKIPSKKSGKFIPVRIFVPIEVVGQPGAKVAFQISLKPTRNEQRLAVDYVRVSLVKINNGSKTAPSEADLQELAKRLSAEKLEERAAALEQVQSLDEEYIARVISYADTKNPLAAWCVAELKKPENRSIRLTATKFFQIAEMLLDDNDWALSLCGCKDDEGEMASTNLIVRAKDEQEARKLAERSQIPGIPTARPELFVLPDLMQTETGFKLYRLEASFRGY